jgi:uncharacterized phage protein (TIGR01671 family)
VREYKFRGKRKDNGEWVYGYYFIEERDIEDGIIWRDIPQIQQRYGDHFQYFDVDLATVGQYTGLKDKNGKEIYEGDILEEEPGYYFEVIWSVECAKFKLQWRTKAIQYPEWNRGVNMTVIGNRWDNPELMKEGSV